MGRIEKTVFISYRRTNLPWALAVYQNLTHHGYDVFFDYLSIPSGDFESIIVENIKGRAHFVLLLTPTALERCSEPGDWLRREIETAMAEKRNVIPLMFESFDFGSPYASNALTGKLEKLKRYNGLRIHSDYFFQGMDKLREQFLNVPLDAVVHPLSENTLEVTREHQNAASDARRVDQKQLTTLEGLEEEYSHYYSASPTSTSTGHIDTFLQELATMWASRVPGIQFASECHIPADVRIKIHKLWLTRSLNHVIQSAVDGVMLSKIPSPRILLRGVVVGKEIRIEIEDNGINMQEESSAPLSGKAIAERSSHAESDAGLVETNFIVEANRGRVFLRNKSDERGTTVAVDFPVLDRPQDRQEK